MTPPRLIPSLRWPVAVLAAGGAGLLAHARAYRTFVPDDAWISLVYARRLLQGEGLTWVDGERIEAYTNFLWVLACAALGALGLDLFVAARLLGTAAALATVGAAVWGFVRVQDPGNGAGPRRLGALAAAAFLAGSAPVAAWAMGALETSLFTALFAWAIAFLVADAAAPRPTRASVRATGACLALGALTRGDGLLVAGAVAGAAVLLWPGPLATRLWLGIRIAGPSVAAIAGQLTFRRAYYHEWVPNTAHVKLGVSARSLQDGLRYFTEGATTLLVPLLGALAALALALRWRGPDRRRVLLPLFAAAPWLVYVTCIGGDWMPAHRHLLPALPALVLALGVVVEAAWRSPQATRRALCAYCLAIAFMAHGALQVVTPDTRVARDGNGWVWRCADVARGLGSAFGSRRPLMAVDAAGCYPYFSGLPAIDMLGLADRHIARAPRTSRLRTAPGHDIGDGRYVLGRKPDLIAFCGLGNEGACYPGGLQMTAEPTFRAQFAPVRFGLANDVQPPAVIWTRLLGGAVGVQATKDVIRVPAYFLATRADGPAVARLLPSGAIADVWGPTPLPAVDVPAGRWRIVLHGPHTDGARVRATFPDAGSIPGTPSAAGADRGFLELQANGTVAVEIAPRPGTRLAVHEIRLERAHRSDESLEERTR